MSKNFKHIRTLLLALILISVNAHANATEAQTEKNAEIPAAFRSTDFPLPRFASIGSDKVFVRTGPGQQYPILWIYHRKGLPVEIILEYENWRKIRDFDGQTGWAHVALLSGKRSAIVQYGDMANLMSAPSEDSSLMAKAEVGSILNIEQCANGWCKAAAQGYGGWIQQNLLWGVYENENFD